MKQLQAVVMLGVLIVAVGGCAKKGTETATSGSIADTTASAPASATPGTTAEQTEHGEPAVAVTPAGTVSGIWQQIDAEHAKLADAISTGSLGEVHHHAFAIRDLVAALPHTAQGLPAGASTSLAKGVSTVAQEADQLDKAGDAGDLSAAQTGLTALDLTLKEIRAVAGGTQ